MIIIKTVSQYFCILYNYQMGIIIIPYHDLLRHIMKYYDILLLLHIY